MNKTKIMSLCVTTCLAIAAAATVTALTGCAGDRYNRSTGQYIDDKGLSFRVSDALHSDPEYKLGGIDVKAFRGNVQLSGFVPTDEQKKRAGEIARGVQGVVGVENNLTVQSHLGETR
jgi:hyperosmotically inducible periplasmic protein